ncbi:unnamed protein product [Lactuca virosa]|uniref:Uncharacterized protein n=1 Tax=Lactuca virosa TaxID=75947 RepID=A0AAU9N508_9ASTR|nr:unnamed protein product [Lactuca virosa]
MEPVESAANLRSQYLEVLLSRGCRPIPLLTLPAKPVEHPLFQTNPTELVDFKAMRSYRKPMSRSTSEELLNEENFYLTTEAMKSYRKPMMSTSEELLNEEHFYLTTEESEQGLLPVLILSMKESTQSKRPAVVFLHPSNANKGIMLHVDILQLPLILVTMENVPKPPPPIKMLLFHHGKMVIQCHLYMTRCGTL